MSQSAICYICKDMCHHYKTLYDESGHRNTEIYNILAIYCHPMLLVANTDKSLTPICLKCWRRIHDFHNFKIALEKSTFKNTIFEKLDDLSDNVSSVKNGSFDDVNNDKEINVFTSDELQIIQKKNIFNEVTDKELATEQCSVLTENQQTMENNVTASSGNIKESTAKPSKSPFFNELPTKKLRIRLRRINAKTHQEQLNITKPLAVLKLQKKPIVKLRRINATNYRKRSLKDQQCDAYDSAVSIGSDNEETNLSEIDFSNSESDYEPSEIDEEQEMTTQPSEKARVLLRTSKHRTSSQTISNKRKSQPLSRPSKKLRTVLSDDELTDNQKDDDDVSMNHEGSFNSQNESGDISTESLDTYNFKSNIKQLRKTRNSSSQTLGDAQTTNSKTGLQQLGTNVNLILSWRETLNCPLCNESLANWIVLKGHFKNQHPNERCYYECCYRKFYYSQLLADHALLHADPKSFTCEICEESYSGRVNLKKHLRRAHDRSALDKGATRTSKPVPSHAKLNSIIAQWTTNLECNNCNETFANFSLLTGHFVEVHPNEKAHIVCCKRKFEGRAELADHAKLHLDIGAFHCTVCNKIFGSSTSLGRHMYKVHAILASGEISKAVKPKFGEEVEKSIAKWKSILDCGICNQSFEGFQFLKAHFQNEHPQEREFIVCCKRTIRGRHSIAEHAKYHLDPDSFKCKRCKRLFATNECLCNHMKRGHCKPLDVQHICSVCSKKCPNEKSLKEHMAAHIGVYLYQCSGCERKFRNESNLHKHIHKAHPVLHSEIKKNSSLKKSLQICTDDIQAKTKKASGANDISNSNNDEIPSAEEQTFRKLPNQLLAEQADVIANWTSNLKCGVCETSHSTFLLLIEHFKNKHPKESFPKIMCCNRIITERFAITDHARYHLDPNAFKCKVCNKCFTNGKLLWKHMRRVHSLKRTGEAIRTHHICRVCNVDCRHELRLKEHMASHTLTFLYKCACCSQKFRQSTILYKHLAEKHPALYADMKKQPNLRKSMEISSSEVQVAIKTTTTNENAENLVTSDNDKNQTMKTLAHERFTDDVAAIAKWTSNLKCEICKTSHSTFEVLSKHFKEQHPKEKMPYIECCKRKQKGVHLMADHARLHMDPNAFTCDVCGNRSVSTVSLRAHKHKLHGKQSKRPLE